MKFGQYNKTERKSLPAERREGNLSYRKTQTEINDQGDESPLECDDNSDLPAISILLQSVNSASTIQPDQQPLEDSPRNHTSNQSAHPNVRSSSVSSRNAASPAKASIAESGATKPTNMVTPNLDRFRFQKTTPSSPTRPVAFSDPDNFPVPQAQSVNATSAMAEDGGNIVSTSRRSHNCVVVPVASPGSMIT